LKWRVIFLFSIAYNYKTNQKIITSLNHVLISVKKSLYTTWKLWLFLQFPPNKFLDLIFQRSCKSRHYLELFFWIKVLRTKFLSLSYVWVCNLNFQQSWTVRWEYIIVKFWFWKIRQGVHIAVQSLEILYEDSIIIENIILGLIVVFFLQYSYSLYLLLQNKGRLATWK